VGRADLFVTGEVGYGAAEFDNPHHSSGGQPELLERRVEQFLGGHAG
jgi:hypothetical protein